MKKTCHVPDFNVFENTMNNPSKLKFFSTESCNDLDIEQKQNTSITVITRTKSQEAFKKVQRNLDLETIKLVHPGHIKCSSFVPEDIQETDSMEDVDIAPWSLREDNLDERSISEQTEVSYEGDLDAIATYNEKIRKIQFLEKLLEIYKSPEKTIKEKGIVLTVSDISELLTILTDAVRIDIFLDESYTCGCIPKNNDIERVCDILITNSNGYRSDFRNGYPDMYVLLMQHRISIKYVRRNGVTV